MYLNVRRVASAALFGMLVAGPAIHAQTSMPADEPDTNGPLAIKYKGIGIQPVGFFAAEGLFRSRNETSDIGSSYNSIPYGNTSNGKLTEFRGSGRQSRVGLAAGGDLGRVKLDGYFEGDFLGVGTSSNSNESNSYVFRVRQFFARAAFANGFTFSGGQMWSLITTDRMGATNRTEQTPYSIDAQYVPGFDWARQWGLRIAQSGFNKQVTFALSAEEPQMTVGGHGAPAQTLIGNPGNSLLNATANYSVDIAPDVIAKIAFDPKGFGHWELKALGRLFRDRVVDTGNVVGGTRTATREGGGVGAAFIIPIVPHYVDFSASGLWGRGIGRYGSAQLPDVVIGPDGTVKPLLAAHGLAGFDIHAGKKLDIYLNGGVEYAARQIYYTSATKSVGYGQPTVSNAGCDTELPPTGEYAPVAGTCTADTRALWQGTAGFWYRFYKGKVGTFQWGMQYSYTTKETWSDVNSYAPQAIENMAFTSFRYVLP